MGEYKKEPRKKEPTLPPKESTLTPEELERMKKVGSLVKPAGEILKLKREKLMEMTHPILSDILTDIEYRIEKGWVPKPEDDLKLVEILMDHKIMNEQAEVQEKALKLMEDLKKLSG